MVDLAAVAGAFGILSSSWTPWLVVVPGLLIGLVGGALPGISGTMTMALFLPFVLYMDFLSGMLFLTAMFTGGNFGGAVPAILVNLPGTTSAVSTAFDGFPMSRKGLHNEALGLGLSASSVATALGYFVLILLVNFVATAVLSLGPLEMLLVAIWGLTMIAALRAGSLSKGLAAGVFGLILGTVGMSPTGVMRGTFGLPWLIDGIPVVPAMIGLLATGELFNLAHSRYIVEDEKQRVISFRRILGGAAQILRYPGTMLRGSLLGILIGAVPGVGSSVANLISYGVTKRGDPDPDSYGKGNPRGVVASESANSSSEGGAIATLLALGIPGGGGTAVLLAAFAMHNITGGPRFIQDNKDVVYAILFANLAQAVLLFAIGLLFIRAASTIVRVPISFLIPTVLVLATCGSFALTGNMTGPMTLVVFSVAGWVLARFDYSTPAAVVGLLLGGIVEGELVRSFQISGGNPSYILERPIALALLALFLASLAWRPLLGVLNARRSRTLGSRENA